MREAGRGASSGSKNSFKRSARPSTTSTTIQYNPRVGYRLTLEDSLYLRHDMTGRGLGRLLLEELLVRARALGTQSVLAKIVATQERSLALHARCGFTEVGRLREVGFKLERWVDVVFMQRLLT